MEYIAISLQAKAENIGYKVDSIVFKVGFAFQLLCSKLIKKIDLLYKL
jgi:hypothetical protein